VHAAQAAIRKPPLDPLVVDPRRAQLLPGDPSVLATRDPRGDVE